MGRGKLRRLAAAAAAAAKKVSSSSKSSTITTATTTARNTLTSLLIPSLDGKSSSPKEKIVSAASPAKKVSSLSSKSSTTTTTKNSLTSLFFAALDAKPSTSPKETVSQLTAKIATRKKTVSSSHYSVHTQVAAEKSPKKPVGVSSRVLSLLKKASSRNGEELPVKVPSGDESARDITRLISTILSGNTESTEVALSQETIDGTLLGNELGRAWVTNVSPSGTSLRQKEVSRERKAKWIFKNTQTRRFDRLVKKCAMELGTESTLQVFGKLGRETGVKEYNALIGLCIDKARECKDENDSLVQLHKAFQLFRSMREQGYQVEEESYGPFLMYLIDMEMIEEFQFFSGIIKDEHHESYSRIGYYEMLLWIRVGNEDKIQELCNSIGVDSSKENYGLAESYLLAFCKSDRKKEVLQLLEVLNIKKISSLKDVATIFKSLGRLSLEDFAKKFILDLKVTEAGDDHISFIIYDYLTSIPNLSVEEVVSKFNSLHERLQVVPCSASYDKLIMFCCHSFKVHANHDPVSRASMQSCELNWVRPAYSAMHQHNLTPNKETCRSVVSLYVMVKDFEGAYSLLADLTKMNVMPTTSMYNAIMIGYFREKNVHGGLMVLQQMEEMNVKPDSETLSYLISNSECEEDIVKYRDEMLRFGVEVTKHVYMALTNAYANCGKFDLAKQVFLDPGVPVKYKNEIKSVLISALASNGQISDALEVYDEMKQAGCSIEPKAIVSLIEYIPSEREIDRVLHLLGELDDSSFWFDACRRVILYCVRYSLLDSAVDLLKQLKLKDYLGTCTVIDEMFSQIWETEPTNLEIGLELLKVVKEDLGLHPSRTSLDFLLSACVKKGDQKSAQSIWAEYSKAGIPFNVLTYLRMYQALLASGDHKSAGNMLKKIPKNDPHVRWIIEACESTYHLDAKRK